MLGASTLPSPDPDRAALRRRAIGVLLTIAAHILILLMLLRLAPAQWRVPDAINRLITIQMPPPQRLAGTPTPVRAKRSSGGASHAAKAQPKPTTAPPAPLSDLIPLSKADFAASDVARLPSHRGELAAAGDGGGAGGSSGAAYGPGRGPGGDQLYAAQWYREPSDAELSGYLPHGAPAGSWADIACQTVEKYHVDNCRELGDGPAGSGLARAMRQAAWQFLVRPPRVGGKPLVGSWVRIHISWTDRGVSGSGGADGS